MPRFYVRKYRAMFHCISKRRVVSSNEESFTQDFGLYRAGTKAPGHEGINRAIFPPTGFCGSSSARAREIEKETIVFSIHARESVGHGGYRSSAVIGTRSGRKKWKERCIKKRRRGGKMLRRETQARARACV